MCASTIVAPVELGATQVRRVKQRPGQIGSGQVGAFHIGLIEVGVLQICVAEIRIRQSRGMQDGVGEVRATEVGTAQITTFQADAAQVAARTILGRTREKCLSRRRIYDICGHIVSHRASGCQYQYNCGTTVQQRADRRRVNCDSLEISFPAYPPARLICARGATAAILCERI